jgi:hypothetical protein
MASLTLTLSGNTSTLAANYFPPIELDENSQYVCGLVDFQTFMSIPNVTEKNNRFYYHSEPKSFIEIPVGCYEISEIIDYLVPRLQSKNVKLIMKVNKNTMYCGLWCDVDVDFRQQNNIGSIFGFENRLLKSSETHLSSKPVNVSNLNVIKFECNITSGAYSNSKSVHTLHEFFPLVEKGYKLVEVPRNIIYLPVIVHTIHNLVITIVNQNDELVDFRGETITLRVHIKKL